MEMLKIRKEEKQDYKEVENLIREAFWNVYVPGCSEHYVAHELRAHEDFVPELDLVNEVLYHNAVLKIAGGESVSY